MAVEVLDNFQGFSKLWRELANVDEAVTVHLQSMQNLLTLLAKQQERRHPHQPTKPQNLSLISESDATISDFKKLPILLGGSGHARFRHAPATPLSQISSQGLHAFDKVRSTSSFPHDAVQTAHILERLNSDMPPGNQLCSPCKKASRDQNLSDLHVSGHARCRDSTAHEFYRQDSAELTQASPQVHIIMPCQSQHPFRPYAEPDQSAAFVPNTNSSFLSSLSTDGGAGTVSNGKPVISSRRPPLPPKKRKSDEKIKDCTIKCHNSLNCHCAKRRKLKTRRIVRVSTMGLNNGDIPADGYSWCVYGEKLSKDSSQPRVYYKCSNVRGCPARKHVEQASDDPNTLIVTYGREHLHPQIHKVLKASE